MYNRNFLFLILFHTNLTERFHICISSWMGWRRLIIRFT